MIPLKWKSKGLEYWRIKLSDIESHNEMTEFYLGVDAFNKGNFPDAHHIWEHSWMRIGKSNNRTYLKPFIMLSVSYQNYELGKVSGGDYLIKRALERLKENQNSIKKYIDVNSLIHQIQKVIKNEKLLNRFNNIQINGVKNS